jgi:hypothetical protein
MVKQVLDGRNFNRNPRSNIPQESVFQSLNHVRTDIGDGRYWVPYIRSKPKNDKSCADFEFGTLIPFQSNISLALNHLNFEILGLGPDGT